MSDTRTAAPDPTTGLQRRSSKVAIVFSLMVLLTGVLWIALGHSSSTTGLRPIETVPRAPYTPAPFPLTAALQGLPVTSTNATPQPPSRAIRAIDVSPGIVRLRTAGAVTRQINIWRTPAITLHEITVAIADPSWISERHTGQFVLNAALVLHHGVGLTAIAPHVTSLRLAQRPGVVLGIEDPSQSRLSGVAITSVSGGTPWAGANAFRPSVIFAHGANVDIAHCRIHHLGWDWNASYGISWLNGATGSIRNSVVREDFIGLYAQRVSSLIVASSRFTQNHLYGIDPHTSSHNVVVLGNTTDHNAAHGIIFANGVTRSSAIDNRSFDNGENGIMMDAGSSGNRIYSNLVANNRGDGVVIAGSTGTIITGNTISANRVGLQVRSSGHQAQVTGNTITGNEVTVQGIAVDHSTNDVTGPTQGTVVVPASQWRWIVLFNLLPITLALGIGSVLLRRRELRMGWQELQRRQGAPSGTPPRSWRELRDANRRLLIEQSAALDRSEPLPRPVPVDS